MKYAIFLTRQCFGVVLVLLSTVTLAQEEAQISEFSFLDNQYMENQRRSLDDLTRRHLGRQFRTDKNNDLELLQLLLNKKLVTSSQTLELQAMGAIMGDLLASDLDMHWIVYEDKLGRSRALRYRETENYLFPMTMISRRREVGNLTPVVQIYQKAYDLIDPLREPLPFQ